MADKKLYSLSKHQVPKLLEKLNIDPGDIQGLEALSVQLENLESHGLVERSSRGWMWAK